MTRVRKVTLIVILVCAHRLTLLWAGYLFLPAALFALLLPELRGPRTAS